ncbi:MAG: hypothetical protein A2735_00780 [Candidatus Yanofskybacteria bacterium RIFCSPHIGHO2_01_FULL_41_21]|uniref:Hydrolase TatD n=1 Tax=Candidatus Yanofskybacteria bacterium RIFCSPHIGHO2_01_FULL_41_21 TaxID=1802660 RepID=A0A1F8EDD8_9BACT|nr:MAG: hypothetical protein A2735_00780 [Candidatus Yanofskybacteria bacterium RIFCSPHIGHO2_01_FULL_41_21]
MIFDSHCHPQFPQYDSDREEMIKRNLEKGVSMIAVGADLETSKQAIELANKYDGSPSPDGFGRAGIWATVGLHPDDIKDDFKIEDYKILATDKKVVAIGEVGLDYYRKEKEQSFDQIKTRQKEIFSQFIDLSLEVNKPLVLHCRSEKGGRSVHVDVIEILKTVNSKLETVNSPLCGVAHSFTGSIEEAQKYLDLGFYLGFNGIITFTKEYDEMIKNIPLDKILIETDAPWLTPEPNRGKRNEPSGVFHVAQKISELKDESLEKIIEQTNQNCKELFKI